MTVTYATLPDRIKAALIDSVLLIIVMFILSEMLSQFENVPSYIRMLIFVFLFILYDPLFISLFGATIGHSYCNISVKKENNFNKNIAFPQAVIRYILKITLGWISLLTTNGNEKKKAIHDYAVGSIVVEDQK